MHWKQEVRKLWRQVRQIATKDGGQPVGKPKGTAERIGDSEGKDGLKGERGIYKVRRPGKPTVRDLLSDSDSRTRCSFLRETRVGEYKEGVIQRGKSERPELSFVRSSFLSSFVSSPPPFFSLLCIPKTCPVFTGHWQQGCTITVPRPVTGH